MPIPLPPGLPRPRAVSGNQIAADALRYRGAGYVFGGNASRPGLWDCSSFVSYVLGHDLKLALPGGRWGSPGEPPGTHGPTVDSYAGWKGAVTVHAPGARGDLVCFVGAGANGHMGIVLGPDQMVSALDSASGTLVTPITGYGPPGAPIVYRRVLGVAAGTAVGGAMGAAGAAAGTVANAATGSQGTGAMVVALILVGTMATAVLAAAVLIGTGVAVAGAWLAGRARA